MKRLAAYGEPVEGTPFGRYRLIELLGRGGMGEVWRAHDTAANNRTVAIKLLPPHLAGDNTFVVRFRREADAAAQLNNPHIIPIHNYGEIDGRLYVDMRLIEGRDLQQVLAEGPLEPGRAVRIIEGVAEALQAAHEMGLVHRDVKPSNILLDKNDFAYLIDFGIARATEDTRLTGTGGVIGSWPYMSPERLRAGQVDARSDIYALACVLYECLTGSTPYPGDNFEQQMTAHLMDPPPHPSSTHPNIPKQFDQVIATGMAKDPDNRYATTVELADAAHDAITTPLAPPSEPTLLDPTRPAPARLDDQVHPRPHCAAAGVATARRPEPRCDPTTPTRRPPVPPPRPADRPPPDTRTPPRQPWWRRQAETATPAPPPGGLRPRRRLMARASIGLGATLLIAALLLWTYTTSKITKIPLNIDTTLISSGSGTALDAASLSGDHVVINQNVPLVSQQQITVESPANADVITLQVSTSVRRADKQKDTGLLLAIVDTVTLNRTTALAVSSDTNPGGSVQKPRGSNDTNPPAYIALRHEGLSYRFPFHTEKKTYPYFDPIAQKAYDAIYAGKTTSTV